MSLIKASVFCFFLPFREKFFAFPTFGWKPGPGFSDFHQVYYLTTYFFCPFCASGPFGKTWIHSFPCVPGLAGCLFFSVLTDARFFQNAPAYPVAACRTLHPWLLPCDPCRWRMLVRSFSATKDKTCRTISLRNVPIRSFPRRVSKSGMSSTTMSITISFVRILHWFWIFST